MIRNNQKLRELLTLPPIPGSASTALAAPIVPKQEAVTGDKEVDAVLWLQSLVKTGNPAMIEKALELAGRITTPMDELGKRYASHIARTTGNAFGAALSSFGFGELEDQAKRAKVRAARKHEALSRFGTIESLFAETPAEKECKKALRGLKRDSFGFYDEPSAAVRFDRSPVLAPATIDDCLYARAYWHSLYWLRADSVEHSGDSLPQAYAHKRYCHDALARISPRNGTEAMAALDHINEDGGPDWSDALPIIQNLISSGWLAAAQGDQQ